MVDLITLEVALAKLLAASSSEVELYGHGS